MQFEVSRYAIDKDGHKTSYYKKGYIDEKNVVHVTEESGEKPSNKQLKREINSQKIESKPEQKRGEPITIKVGKPSSRSKFDNRIPDEDAKFMEEYEKKLKANSSDGLKKRIVAVKDKLKKKMENEISEELLVDYRAITYVLNELEISGKLSSDANTVLQELEKQV